MLWTAIWGDGSLWEDEPDYGSDTESECDNGGKSDSNTSTICGIFIEVVKFLLKLLLSLASVLKKKS